MPYLDPGSLTDEEAQLLAAFITSKPRPSYPFKHQDYRTEKLPVDSVYYPQRAISGQPSTLSQPSAVSSQRRN
jgi:cytochrome c